MRGFIGIERLLGVIDRIAVWLGAAIVATMAAVVVASVVSRYYFLSPLIWSDELVRILLVAVTFIGPIPQMIRGGFGEVDFIKSILPSKMRQLLRMVVAVLGTTFCGLFAVMGLYLVFISPAARSQVTPALEIPVRLLYGLIPFCFTTMFLRELVNLIGILTEPKQIEGAVRT